ncbi:MAG: hypothetical protein RL477_1998 [Pseudomonadota bacterium]|jgi:hypothetical protein
MPRFAAVLFFGLCACASLIAPAAVHAQSGPAQAKTVTLHFTNGLRFDLPPGWRFSELAPTSVMLHRGTTDAALAGTNKDSFRLIAPLSRDDAVGKSYGRLDRQGNQTLPGGTKVEWYAGPRYNGMHYAFSAQIENNYRYLTMSYLDRPTPAFTPAAFEAAVIALAQSVRKTDFHRVFYHPAGMQSAIPNDMWFSKSTEGALRFGCFQTYCGKDGNTWLYAYRSAVAFKTDDEAIKDITGYFEKQEKLKVGATRRLAVEGGTLLWTEQPGTARPLLGALRRAGQYYFVSAFDLGKTRYGLDNLRPHFLHLATSLRPWDGR